MGVSILPPKSSGMDLLGQYIGQGIQNAMPQQYENMKYQRGMSAIDKLQETMKNPDLKQGDVLAELARAITSNPNLERSGLAEYFGKLAQAKGAANIPPPGGGEVSRDRELIPAFPQRQEVTFLNQPPKTFPNNIGPQEQTGNVPQEATEGKKKPIKDSSQMRKNSIRRSKEANDQGFPLTPQEAYREEVEENDQNKIYNAEVDKETAQRKTGQREYGQFGSEALKKAYPAASDKMLARAQKWGEDASVRGKSEAEIKEHIIEKANELANHIDSIKNSLSRPNAINNIERAAAQNYRTFDQGVQDVRNHLKPLLDEGLYDESRGLLEELNYGPEEREMIINPLSQKEQTILNGLPKSTGTGPYKKAMKIPEANINDLKNVLLELKQSDPNFSPLLARRYAEDRGYDWRMFKDAWNTLIIEDAQLPEDQKNFTLTGDQKKFNQLLDTPPLDMLGKILHGMELRGR